MIVPHYAYRTLSGTLMIEMYAVGTGWLVMMRIVVRKILLISFTKAFVIPYTDVINFYQSSHRMHVEKSF